MEIEQRSHFQVFVLLCGCNSGDVWSICFWFLLHHQKDCVPNGHSTHRRLHELLLQNCLLYRTVYLHLLPNKNQSEIFPNSLLHNPIFNDNHHNPKCISKRHDDPESKFQPSTYSLHIISHSRTIYSKLRRKRFHKLVLSNHKQTKDDVLCRLWYKLGKNLTTNLDIFHKLVRLQSFQRSRKKFPWKRLSVTLWKNVRPERKTRNTGILTWWWWILS